MGPLTWLDGGLATALQARGLPPMTPVDDWVMTRPDEVRAAHRAFVEAGAEVLLAGTFRALPGVSDRWREVAGRAVALAREAAAGRAAVWASIGPAEPDAAAALARAARADGVVLETWTDAERCAEAVAAVRRVWDGPLVASLVPRAGPVDPPLRRLAQAGADGVGFNCGRGPDEVVDAIERAMVALPLWAKPAGEGARTVGALRRLAARCRWVGGCCGVGADLLREARVSLLLP